MSNLNIDISIQNGLTSGLIDIVFNNIEKDARSKIYDEIMWKIGTILVENTYNTIKNNLGQHEQS